MCLSLCPATALAEGETAEEPAAPVLLSDEDALAQPDEENGGLVPADEETTADLPDPADAEDALSPDVEAGESGFDLIEEEETDGLSAAMEALDDTMDEQMLLEATAENRTELASGFCGAEGSNLRWVLYDNGCLVLSGVGAMAEGECPWEANLESITSVVVSDGVTVIGSSAFSWARNLAAVELPDSLTSIGGYAFDNCSSLTRITIPAHVTDIAVRAFYGCSALTAIEVSTDNAAYASEDGVLFNKAKTELVCCPSGKSGSYQVPAGVSRICSRAFEYCTFSEILLPDSVTVIDDYAFASCSQITSILLPAGLKRLEAYVFKGCASLEEIEIPAAVLQIGSGIVEDCVALQSIRVAQNNAYYSSVDGVLFSKDASRLISYPAGRSGAYTVPGGTRSVGDAAFCNCSGLTGITFPNGLNSIGFSAFLGCLNLETLVFPAGLATIESSAFFNCRSLRSVTLSTGVNIHDNVFFGCSALKNVSFGGTEAQKAREVWTTDGNQTFFDASWQYLGAERTIHSFADLKALVEAYDGSSVFAFYNDTAPFVIEESIVLPENFYFCADAEGSVLRIPAGVTLRVDSAASNAFYTEHIVLDGALVGRWESIVGEISGSGYWKRSETNYFFYSEDALRELSSGSYDQWTLARYGGSDGFRFTQNLVTPPNLQLVLENGMLVPAGVQVSIKDSFYTTDAVIDGALLLDHSADNTENRFSSCNSLSVSGSFTVRGRINVYYGELQGRDRITVEGNDADFRRYVNTSGFGEMMDLLAAAGEDTTPHVSYFIYSSVGEEDGYLFELFLDMEVPANTFLQLNGDLFVADGVTLHNAGKMEILSPATVYGSFVNDGYAELHGDEPAMTLVDGGQYGGPGELAVVGSAHTQEALAALLPGLNLSYFAEIRAEVRASDTIWHLRYTPQLVTAQVASLTLDGTIGINYLVSMTDSVMANENARAVFVYKGVEYPRIMQGMVPDSRGFYTFTFYIPAAEFANTVSLKFMDGENVIPFEYDGKRLTNDTMKYSGQRYSKALPASNPARPLIDMLHNYCYNAYLGLKKGEPDVLPNPIMTNPDISTVAAADMKAYRNTMTGSVTGLTINAISLNLESTTEINLRFTPAEGRSIEEFRFEVNGRNMTLQPVSGGSYLLTIENIAAKDLDTMYTVKVSSGSEEMEIRTSALAYCYSVLKNNLLTTEMQNTCKALYLYNQAANAYFGG